jgi:hypothetical protein
VDAASLEALAGVEVLTPYRDGGKDAGAYYALWAVADRARGPLLAPAGALARWLYGRRRRAIRAHVASLVAAREPDAVLALWGMNAYPEAATLLEHAERAFVVAYDWNCYPLGDEVAGTRGANAIDRWIAERADVRIHASARALGHMQSRMRLDHGIDVVFPDGFSELARPRAREPRWSDETGEPHVIHHGTWIAHPDGPEDARPFLRPFADAGIHVHYPGDNASGSGARLHPYRAYGHRETLRGEFLAFSSRADAALILYAPRRRFARFRNLLPTRFLSGVASGLPAALPAGLLPACEDFVHEHGNGFTFRDPAELAARLRDRRRLAELRVNAEALASRFSLEARLPILEDAIRSAQSGPDAPRPVERPGRSSPAT